MKKERHCSTPYPVYPAPMVMPNAGYPQTLPMYPNQPMMPNQGMTPNTNQPVAPLPGNGIEGQLNTLMNQMNNLERRVTALESVVGTTSYNNTNYQMM